jgi:hypothetical protein
VGELVLPRTCFIPWYNFSISLPPNLPADRLMFRSRKSANTANRIKADLRQISRKPTTIVLTPKKFPNLASTGPKITCDMMLGNRRWASQGPSYRRLKMFPYVPNMGYKITYNTTLTPGVATPIVRKASQNSEWSEHDPRNALRHDVCIVDV